MYWARAAPIRNLDSTRLSTSAVDYELIHRRLGHPSKEVIRAGRKHIKDFPDVNIPSVESVCPGCQLGKQPNRPFSKNEVRATKPFELIHSDLKSFEVESYHKNKYAIVFYDDYTSMGWVLAIRSKDRALSATKEFLTYVSNQYNTQVKGWMSDAGGEFKSAAYKQLMRDHGIHIYESAPHTPQQNGRAERFIRTLMDKAQAMRLHACLPPSYWEFAFAHAAHVYNRTPKQGLNWRTPSELLLGKPPSISHLRVFGCGAYVHLPADTRGGKLEPKSQLMVYLGVAPTNDFNYMFMRPNGSLHIYAHAVFDENLFPRCPEARPHKPISDAPKRPHQHSPADPPPPTEDLDGDTPLPHRIREPIRRSPSPERVPSPAPTERSERTPSPAPPPPPVTPPRRIPPMNAPPALPRRSERIRRPPTRPGNVYGEREAPVKQIKEIEKESRWKELTGQSKPSAPDTPNIPGAMPPSPSPSEDDVERLVREGGDALVSYLCAKAIPLDNEEVTKPNYREWSYRDILQLPESEQKLWFEACRKELDMLKERKVYEVVDRPTNRKVIKNRWVFDVKSDGRKRARLVAKGFSQTEGLDFDQIFSPVVRFETVRCMLALVALENWYLSGLDVRSAYLYGTLDEEIYMEFPEGFHPSHLRGKVLRLKRALYGLKQAGLAWWKALNKSMKELGFKRLHSDAGLFIYRKGKELVLAIIYVDDAQFCGPVKAVVERLKAAFMKKWECRDLGETREFLRMNIRRDGRRLHIDQCEYLEKVLERCGMINAKPARTPLPQGYQPEKSTAPVNMELRTRFQTVIGSLLYLMLGTRPDIAYAVTQMARMSANPTKEHLDKALYICRYLIGTREYSLVYDGTSGNGLTACTDSDWGADPDTRHSQTGFYIKLANAVFLWNSHLQKTTALSSTEAEYMALSDCSRQVIWIKQMFGEIGFDLKAIPICGDNQGLIFIASNPVIDRHSKHIPIRYNFIRDAITDGHVEVFYIEGTDNPADMFTKNLGYVKFEQCRSQLGLIFKHATSWN
jgi:hypothetical protein